MKKSELKQLILEVKQELLTESKDTGLYVIASSPQDNKRIQKWIDKSPYYAEYDARENYWLFDEDENSYDNLEKELDKEFNKNNISARFEAI